MSLNTTTYLFPDTMPVYALRRISDGLYLGEDGSYVPMAENLRYVDTYTTSNHWNPVPEGHEVVAISQVYTISAVPINWL